MKIKNLKKAVGDFQRANAGGKFSPRYGYLMYDTTTGILWTDEFYDLGHSWYADYHDRNEVVNLGAIMQEHDMPVTMANVKEAIERKLYNDSYMF